MSGELIFISFVVLLIVATIISIGRLCAKTLKAIKGTYNTLATMTTYRGNMHCQGLGSTLRVKHAQLRFATILTAINNMVLGLVLAYILIIEYMALQTTEAFPRYPYTLLLIIVLNLLLSTLILRKFDTQKLSSACKTLATIISQSLRFKDREIFAIGATLGVSYEDPYYFYNTVV